MFNNLFTYLLTFCVCWHRLGVGCWQSTIIQRSCRAFWEDGNGPQQISLHWSTCRNWIM